MSNIYLVDTPECIRTAPLFGVSNTKSKQDLQKEIDGLLQQNADLLQGIDKKNKEIQRLDDQVYKHSVSTQTHNKLQQDYDNLQILKENLQKELHQQNEDLLLRINAQDKEIDKRLKEYQVLQYNYEKIHEWNQHLQTEIDNLRQTLQPSRHDADNGDADNGQNPDGNP